MPMLPLATQVHVRGSGGLPAARGRRGRAWGPWVPAAGAYDEPTGSFPTNSLLYTTKQYKTASDVPAAKARPLSVADVTGGHPRPQRMISDPEPPQTGLGGHTPPVFKRAGVYNKLQHLTTSFMHITAK